MDIWMTICRRTAKCHFCSKPIILKEPIVKGKLWRKHGELQKWSYMMYWHPYCWADEGLVAVSKMKYDPGNRGRKQLLTGYNDKIERVKILKRHARYVQKIRESMESGNVDRVIRLYNNMEKLKAEILLYGGIPNTWLVNLNQSENSSPVSIKRNLQAVVTLQLANIYGNQLSMEVTYGSADTVMDLGHSQYHSGLLESSPQNVS